MKNLLQTFVFFPMPLIWFMFIILLVGSKQTIYYFFRVIFLVLFILSLPIFSSFFEYPLKKGADSFSEKKNLSMVLVPTAGVYEDSLGNWYASKDTILRTMKGYDISKKLGIPLLISGGITIKGAPAESLIAIKYLSDTNAVIVDVESKNTFQSARNLRKIVKNNKIENGTIILATSSIHNLRTSLALRTNGFDVGIYENINHDRSFISQLIPHTNSFSRINGLIYEYLGIIKYIFTGYINYKAFFK